MAIKTKTNLIKVDFQLMAPQANKVILSGNFNEWDVNAIVMKKLKSGLWKASVKLPSGRYEYKFIVDNEWWTDPSNERTAGNSFGNLNSVMEI